MFKISAIALALLASTSVFADDIADGVRAILNSGGETVREKSLRRAHEIDMENEAFLARQHARDAEMDQQLTNYYLRNDRGRYGY